MFVRNFRSSSTSLDCCRSLWWWNGWWSESVVRGEIKRYKNGRHKNWTRSSSSYIVMSTSVDDIEWNKKWNFELSQGKLRRGKEISLPYNVSWLSRAILFNFHSKFAQKKPHFHGFNLFFWSFLLFFDCLGSFHNYLWLPDDRRCTKNCRSVRCHQRHANRNGLRWIFST